MGYNDNCAVVVHKEILEPHNSLGIKTVGRLVKKEDSRVTEECAGKEDLDLLGLVEGAHKVIENAVGKTQTLQELACVGLSVPAAKLSKFSL